MCFQFFGSLRLVKTILLQGPPYEPLLELQNCFIESHAASDVQIIEFHTYAPSAAQYSEFGSQIFIKDSTSDLNVLSLLMASFTILTELRTLV